MNFLVDLGINSIVVDKFAEVYSEEEINNALLNQKKIIESIIFFKKNGLTNVDKVLLYKLSLFYLGEKNLVEVLNKDSDIKTAIQKLNDDYNYADHLMELFIKEA